MEDGNQRKLVLPLHVPRGLRRYQGVLLVIYDFATQAPQFAALMRQRAPLPLSRLKLDDTEDWTTAPPARRLPSR
jgi:hypothetical protein